MDIPKWMKRITYTDGDSALKKFFDELKNKKFMTTKCEKCDKPFFPPKSCCPNCLSTELSWIELKGYGKIYAFTQHDRALVFHPPEVIGLVELNEGIGRVLTKIDGKYDELKIGMDVKIDFVELSPDFTLHKFVPVKD
jgi:hypothetical protein